MRMVASIDQTFPETKVNAMTHYLFLTIMRSVSKLLNKGVLPPTRHLLATSAAPEYLNSCL